VDFPSLQSEALDEDLRREIAHMAAVLAYLDPNAVGQRDDAPAPARSTIWTRRSTSTP